MIGNMEGYSGQAIHFTKFLKAKISSQKYKNKPKLPKSKI
jgi:hypothetical protein